ncbi:phage baseplate assembly protein V [Dissulfurirhabdus thermomarina]|uniref:Phage baseplate assembly protein V n=1 Tax=Dissulfurirhabdus thermomarina TaxID=1765737 RepID=A0A6N9TN83_DISTH|nr:phage baseplate assembly protein V [Dissulfurirhabdus thermomarina]NDY41244.1 phage baseplate assembly protein V [Dissulfurirhabdus thermomarina]
MELIRTIRRVLDPLSRRVRLMVGRGVLARVDDGAREQVVQVELLAGEVRELERYQEYGFSSVPHAGSEGIVVCIGGTRDHGIMVATGDRRYRLTGMAPGEVALYDDLGNVVRLGRDQVTVTAVQHLEASAPTCRLAAEVTIDGNVTVHGDVTASGQISDLSGAGGSSMSAMRATYNGHTHPGDSGGTTGPPQQAM